MTITTDNDQITRFNRAAKFGYLLTVADGLVESLHELGFDINSVDVMEARVSLQVDGDQDEESLRAILVGLDLIEITTTAYASNVQATGRDSGYNRIKVYAHNKAMPR